MTTVEKLLVQIFERKNSIIEKVKQQTELYNQHLASKLLIDGITPPTWFWNPSPSPSESKELNKDELISKLLYPYPEPSVRCSVAQYPVYDNPVHAGNNGEFSDGSFIKNLASNKDLNRHDDPIEPALINEDLARCAFNSVPEPDSSVNSPANQTDEQILNIYNAPDQSLAGIQRSKSRQKALELRNSAKALAKSGLSHVNMSDVFPSHIRFSLSATDQAGKTDELPKFAELESCEDRDLDEAHHPSKEKELVAYCGRVTRSKSYAKVPDFNRASLTLGGSSEDHKDNASASAHVAREKRKGSMTISYTKQSDNCVHELPKSTGPFSVAGQSCGHREVVAADSLSKDKGINVYAGRSPTSKISSKSLSCACDSSKSDSSSDDYQRIGIGMMDSVNDLPIHGSLVRVNPSNVISEGLEARESISGDCKSNRKNNLSNDKDIDSYAGRIPSFEISSKCQSFASESSKADSSSDDCQRMDISMMDSGNDLPMHGSLVRVSHSSILNEGFGARESMSGDSMSHRENCLRNDQETDVDTGIIPNSNVSSQCRSCAHDSPKADSSSDNHQRLDIAIMDSGNDLPMHGSLVRVSHSNVLNEGFGARESMSGDSKSHRENCLRNDQETDVDNGLIHSSNMSSKCRSCAHDSPKADSASDDYQRKDIVHSGNGSRIHGSLVRVNPSNILNEGSQARESMSKDCKRHRERSALPSSSSSQLNDCVYQVCDLDITSQSARADSGILAPSSGRSAEQVNNSNEVMGLGKPSIGLFRRVTRSQTRHTDKETYESVDYSGHPSFGGIKSKSDSKQKSAVNDELQNTLSGQVIPPYYGTHDMLDHHGNGDFVVTGELLLHNRVDKSGRSSCSNAKQGRELESQVEPTPLDSFVLVEPEQNFNEIDECNLKTFTSKSENRRLVDSPEKMSCSCSDPAVSLDKGISGGVQLCLGKQSPGMSDVTSKGKEGRSCCFTSDVHENPDSRAEKAGHVISEYTMLKISEDNTEAQLKCKVSEVCHGANIMLPKMVDIPNMQIHPMKLHEEHGLDSSPERHTEEGNWNVEGKDKVKLMSNTHESENSRALHCDNSTKESGAESCECSIGKLVHMNPVCVILDKIKPFPAQKSQILSCLGGEVRSQQADSPVGDNGLVTCSKAMSGWGASSSLERKCRRDSIESWPQLKRRKIECKRNHSFTTSPRFPVGTAHSDQTCPAGMYLKTMEVNLDADLTDGFSANKCTFMEIRQEMDSNQKEGIESPFPYQNEEVGFCPRDTNEQNNSSVFNKQQLGAALISSLSEKEAGKPGDGQCSQELRNQDQKTDNLNSENSDLTNRMLEGIQSPEWEGGSREKQYVLSSSNEELEFTDVDRSMPVFEGFTVNAQADTGKLDFTADGIDLNKLNLPRTTIERASILAEICRSASLDTPLSRFSAFKLQGTENLFHSVPNVRLEHLELGGSLPINSDVDKQFQSGRSLADGYKDAFDGIPYSDCLTYSGARYGWNSRKPPASPIANLWERLSSHSGSSEKRLSSNPELTCFPIEEDPGGSEENKTEDENSGDSHEEADSLSTHHCDKRQVLKDLTNLDLNPLATVSVQEETSHADGLDVMNTKLSVTGTEDNIHWSVKNQYRGKSKTGDKQTSIVGATGGRKKQTSSISTNGMRKAKESINSSINKPVLSNKPSLKREDQKFSLKEARRNNIVSNVSSFIPLIQQKQAATACAGKRDVKVKALEAAEAAKRLEEKRENERKLRKEALKVERAKLEEKNLRDMELEKKKKNEERKKKDADIIARKRLREEEERKEKEKKRIRLEVRQRQREQEEKMRAEKAEKEKRSKDEQMNRKKEFHNESKKQQNMETVRGDDVTLKQMETKWAPTEVVMANEECSTSGQSCEAGKAMHTVDKSPKNEDLIVQNNQGKSYDISPYQCSDDEDEEEDELPTKKYIPSWASKSSVALLLPLQREMDPDMIFPPESFCSMDEVLLPRKLQQKQVTA